MNHTEFEKKLMEMLLMGDDPVLKALRNQYYNSTVESTKFTGAGFYTNLKVNADIPPLVGGKTFRINDIDASFGDIKEAIGFILFIKEGYLLMLEGYTLASDIWPDEYSSVVLIYDAPGGKRDLEELRTKWVN